MSELASGINALFSVQQPNNTEIITVSKLINQIRQSVEGDFKTVAVLGEISSFRPWSSGHWYFDLKDAQSILPCIMFKSDTNNFKFSMQNGIQVILWGKVTISNFRKSTIY